MLDRITLGEVPPKHHVVARRAGGPNAGALLHEECLTREGFDGPYTILYHLERPHTHAPAPTTHGSRPVRLAPAGTLAKRHFKGADLALPEGPLVDGRVPLFANADVTVWVARPTAPDPAYFSNGDADELFYAFEGRGLLRSPLGDLSYEAGDYVCVPKGVPYRWLPDEPSYLLLLECADFGLLRQARNAVGQLRMDAPYGHRDFRRPTFRGPLDEGLRELVVKRSGGYHGFTLPSSPLDVVGWDGTVYPWAFPILAFQPRAGLVHLPPTLHGTFQSRNALVCSFVPRVLDFHPDAIPCPYPHASVDCDELIFYCRGNFTSRRGVGPKSFSLHPMGIPHGPHPGAYEASIGAKTTDELAVMMDTFQPLLPTEDALACEDPGYMASFL